MQGGYEFLDNSLTESPDNNSEEVKSAVQFIDLLNNERTVCETEKNKLKDQISDVSDKYESCKKIIDEQSTCSHHIDHTKRCDICNSFFKSKNMYLIIIIVILLSVLAIFIVRKYWNTGSQ